MRVYGKVINGIMCLVYVNDGIHYAVAINGSGLIATW